MATSVSLMRLGSVDYKLPEIKKVVDDPVIQYKTVLTVVDIPGTDPVEHKVVQKVIEVSRIKRQDYIDRYADTVGAANMVRLMAEQNVELGSVENLPLGEVQDFSGFSESALENVNRIQKLYDGLPQAIKDKYPTIQAVLNMNQDEFEEIMAAFIPKEVNANEEK